MKIKDVEQVVIESNYHRQTAVDKLVKSGWLYRDASNAVGEVFEQLSYAR